MILGIIFSLYLLTIITLVAKTFASPIPLRVFFFRKFNKEWEKDYRKYKLKEDDIVFIQIDNKLIPVRIDTNWKYLRQISWKELNGERDILRIIKNMHPDYENIKVLTKEEQKIANLLYNK